MQPLLAQQQRISDFERAVLPKIQSWLPGCTYISIESVKSDQTLNRELRALFTFLDNKSSCDGILINTKHNCAKFVALRVQRNNKDFSTFTIRFQRAGGLKTEFQKRCESIQRDEIYPQLTVQAYLSYDG
jgi:hypothetical protein